MKNLKIYAILGLSALLVLNACKKDELTEEVSPVLSLNVTTLTVSAEGGTVSVYYQVETPVDGSTVSVDLGEVTWITDVDVTDSTIDLAVEANSENESRTATLTVSYPDAEDVSLTVVQEAAETPVLSLSETTLTVSADGGAVSVAYQVGNPVDRATVSVDKDEDATWVADITVTDSTIDLTIEANSEKSSRSATLTVSYPGAEDVSLTVVQELDYDYSYNLTEFYGILYEDDFFTEEDKIDLYLSDIELNEDGSFQAGGHYYYLVLLLYESDGETLPTGEYTYTSGFYGDYVLSGTYSRYIVQHDSYSEWIAITGGSLTVSKDEEGVYTIEGTLTDENGAYHRICYTGSADLKNYVLKEDLEFTATTAVATYYTHFGDEMNLELVLTDMSYDGYYAYPPGSYVLLDVYMDYNVNGELTPGTYKMNYSYEAPSLSPDYSYAYNYPTESTYDYTCSAISSGTMTIEDAGNDEYKITCDFKTESGYSVKCTYTGPLVVDDMPGASSSLTEDYTLNLGEAEATATCYGDFFENGGNNWYITIINEDGTGDCVSIDLNAQSGTFADGIPSGTYTASSTVNPNIGEYAYGYTYFGFYFYGSWYIEYDSTGYLAEQAPLVDGDITITNNGDGSYKIEFDCTDDAGNKLDGTWEGSITTQNYSSYSYTSTSQGKHSAISRFSKQETNARPAGVKTAKKENKILFRENFLY